MYNTTNIKYYTFYKTQTTFKYTLQNIEQEVIWANQFIFNTLLNLKLNTLINLNY